MEREMVWGMRWVSAGKWFRECRWVGEDGFGEWRSLWRETVWEMELGLVNEDVFGEETGLGDGDGLGREMGLGIEIGLGMTLAWGGRWLWGRRWLGEGVSFGREMG